MYLALFDIDGVLYDGHSIFDIIKLQQSEGFIPKGTWEEIEKLLIAYKTGEIVYEVAANKMLEVYLSSLKGKNYTEVKSYLQNFLKSEKHKFYTYFKKLVPKLKKSHDIYLVTTNLHVTAEILCEHFGLSGFLSTEEEIINGKYTGKVKRSLAGNKHIVVELLEKYPHEKSMAVGDSVNDISMLELVASPFCMNPDEKLKAEANKRGWKIVDENNILSKIDQLLKK